jgi:hypothetical protein
VCTKGASQRGEILTGKFSTRTAATREKLTTYKGLPFGAHKETADRSFTHSVCVGGGGYLNHVDMLHGSHELLARRRVFSSLSSVLRRREKKRPELSSWKFSGKFFFSTAKNSVHIYFL